MLTPTTPASIAGKEKTMKKMFLIVGLAVVGGVFLCLAASVPAEAMSASIPDDGQLMCAEAEGGTLANDTGAAVDLRRCSSSRREVLLSSSAIAYYDYISAHIGTRTAVSGRDAVGVQAAACMAV